MYLEIDDGVAIFGAGASASLRLDKMNQELCECFKEDKPKGTLTCSQNCITKKSADPTFSYSADPTHSLKTTLLR